MCSAIKDPGAAFGECLAPKAAGRKVTVLLHRSHLLLFILAVESKV